mmetsp:Transcript_44311/g.86977  ORF Transcript_44311/g.86977 Transcript_44311/m.86977 type:complete len:247 (-) Transcript_44311:66-806(-)
MPERATFGAETVAPNPVVNLTGAAGANDATGRTWGTMRGSAAKGHDTAAAGLGAMAGAGAETRAAGATAAGADTTGEGCNGDGVARGARKGGAGGGATSGSAGDTIAGGAFAVSFRGSAEASEEGTAFGTWTPGAGLGISPSPHDRGVMGGKGGGGSSRRERFLEQNVGEDGCFTQSCGTAFSTHESITRRKNPIRVKSPVLTSLGRKTCRRFYSMTEPIVSVVVNHFIRLTNDARREKLNKEQTG